MKFLVFTFLFIVFFIAGYSQNKNISVSYSTTSFDDFITDIESKTNYKFYYDSSETSGILITIKLDNASVNQILDTAFVNTGLRFATDESNHIFITRNKVILTSISSDFFYADKNSKKENEELFDFTEKDTKTPAVKNKLVVIGNKTTVLSGSANLSGVINDKKTGEPVSGAYIYYDSTSIGAVTDQYGYYSLKLPKGRHELIVTCVGMEKESIDVVIYSDGKLNINLDEFIATLKNVIVKSSRYSNVKSLLTGVEKLNISTIKKIPPILGETDVLKALLTLPGVTSPGEGSAGFNVRGGSADQNLILFNEATIYNPSHLFGFFSAFNSDVVKSVDLYKSGIPEKYGGRLSSVLDVSSREGNKKKINLSGGIGPLTSKLTLEGPLKKNKSSFLLSGRTTYSDWILRSLKNAAYNKSNASFLDLTGFADIFINKNNTIYLTAYLSEDRFRLSSDTLFKYGNKNMNIKWKHLFNTKLNSVFTAGIDNYKYAISSEQVPVNAFKLSYNISQVHSRLDFNWLFNNQHTFNFGFNSIYFNNQPGSYQPIGSFSQVQPDNLQKEKALESALYFGDKYTVTNNLSFTAGIRFSMFNYLGPHDIYQYAPGQPLSKFTIIDTLNYSNGKIIKTYMGPEFRFSLRYSLSGNSSLKLSFNSLRQYIHLFSNTTVISPTDIWKLSDPNIKPQIGAQLGLGFYNNFKSNSIETSFEVYYKKINDYPDYKSGAVLIMNHYLETEVLPSKGKAYGGELLIKKTAGKLNGWLSYTYSRTWLKTKNSDAGELINRGNYYPAAFDRPHTLNLISNYAFSHRFSVSGTLAYNTGRPVTLPIAIFYLNGAQRVLYSDRNAYKIPDYIRTDISVNIEAGHKIKKLTHSSWYFGAYNLLGRKNPYSVYFTQENGVIKGYKVSIFGSIIPFIAYNFKF